MAFPQETINIIEQIERQQAASRRWHIRHEDAIMALGAVARTITVEFGEKAGTLAYNTGLADLRARDPIEGIDQ